MRSVYVDEFNHDEDAFGYDEEVQNEDVPIRSGYDALLTWVIESARIEKNSRVLDLGVGTGNLSCRIQTCSELIGVDISEAMMNIAKPKLSHIKNVSFIKSDILEYVSENQKMFDVIMSTYTIHHLTEEEKQFLMKEIWKYLKPGGRAVFGDLMVESQLAILEKVAEYQKKGDQGTAESLQEEYFWFVNTAEKTLKQMGFHLSIRRFSDLSFGIAAQKPA